MTKYFVRALIAALVVSGCARVETQKAPANSSLQGGMRFAAAAPVAPPAGTTGRNPALVSRILEARCASCHGPGTHAYAGIDYISDLSQLIARGKVIPGDPIGSDVFQMACGKGPCGPAIPRSELRAIYNWIKRAR